MRFGDAEVTRHVEWLGTIGTVTDLFPDVPHEVWEQRAEQLEPTFWDPATDGYRAVIQTWVVRVDGLTVVVDTGVGDGRDRPQVAQFADLRTGFDEELRRDGIAPEDVDVVVNTHIHYDHVGWNTRWDGRAWVPTFPNARYLVPDEDFTSFDPRAGAMRSPRTEDERRRFAGIGLVYEDSIRPVADAGQVETWSGSRAISPRLHLASAPGHTPGSSVLWLDAEPRAVFVGDLLHSPLQIERPDDACAFDLDAAAAVRSRRRVLAEAAAVGATVLPAHLPGRGAARLSAAGDGFAVDGWADLPAI